MSGYAAAGFLVKQGNHLYRKKKYDNINIFCIFCRFFAFDGFC
jgi:hypothetical protein